MKAALKNAWAQRRRWLTPSQWTLRERVLLPAALLAVVAAGLSTALSGWRLSHQVSLDELALGQSLSRALARNAQELLLGRDASSIQGLIDEYRDEKSLAYVFIVDEQGKVLAHTFTPRFPDGFEELTRPPAGATECTSKFVKVDGHGRLDVAMPILAGTLGVAHVGVDTAVAARQNWLMFLGNLVAVALFLVVGLAWLWGRVSSALDPLQRLSDAVEGVESRGDLTWRAEGFGDDEVGRLSRAFENMLKRLAETPRTLGRQTLRLAEGVQALKRDHQAQGAMLASQAGALAQAQVASEEIRQISRQAAGQAKTLMDDTVATGERSRAGSEALEKGMDSLLLIRSRVELLAADVEALDSRGRRIEDIIDSVKDLADQSNLLALNAAIEAMRAGEHGLGFGLVAREIRALADQSIAATAEVRQVLGDLSDGVRDAAKGSREGVGDIQKGLERIRSSSETLADIRTTLDENLYALQRIAGVVQQQDQGLEQIFLALREQVERMREAEQQQGRTAEAVAQMEQAVRAVEDVVQGFKV